jgi:hypothetical protein
LIRGATLVGSTLALSGDIDTATDITVFAPAAAKTVTWNGFSITTTKAVDGSLVGKIAAPDVVISLHTLTNWKSANSLPEKEVEYDDSGAAWIGMYQSEQRTI